MKEKEVTLRGQFVIRLERDEDILISLSDFCTRRNIKSGYFHAIGAIKDSKVGYYDLENKKYESLEYPDAMEVIPMTGNIATVDGKPFIHAHVVLSDTKNNAVGGHLFAAKVAVTLEVQLTALNEQISRSLDEDIGLKLLAF